MNRFINITAKLKWLGLIGLLGSITGHAYLKLFWLFFLLGFIEIFGNLPVFFQSLQAPTVNAMIPQLVPEDGLMRVNGIKGILPRCPSGGFTTKAATPISAWTLNCVADWKPSS